MAFSAVGALIAGEAVTTTLVLSAVTEVGLAMTVVGAVTGSKTLMKIGGVMSLVGGVGGMVNGALSGAAGAAEGAAGGTIDAAATAGDYVNSADAMSDAFTGTSTGATTGVADAATGMTTAPDMGQLADEARQSLTPTQTDLQREAMPGTPQTDVQRGGASLDTTAPAQSTALVGQPPFQGNNPSAYSADGSTQPLASNATGPAISQLPPTGSADYFSNFMQWVKQNKEVSYGILQLAGGAMKGAAERSMFDEKMNLERQKYGHGNEVATVGSRALIGAAR